MNPFYLLLLYFTYKRLRVSRVDGLLWILFLQSANETLLSLLDIISDKNNQGQKWQ
jgi:hypothetical protein